MKYGFLLFTGYIFDFPIIMSFDIIFSYRMGQQV